MRARNVISKKEAKAAWGQSANEVESYRQGWLASPELLSEPKSKHDEVSPELVAHQAVHDEVSWGDETEEDVRYESQQMIPDGEALTQVTLLYTGPEYIIIETSNMKIWVCEGWQGCVFDSDRSPRRQNVVCVSMWICSSTLKYRV